MLYKSMKVKQNNDFSLMKIWKAIILSSFGLFLLLPSLIWNEYTFEEFHITFVYLYTTLSQLLAYTGKFGRVKNFVRLNLIFFSVVCQCSKLWSVCVILAAYSCKITCENLLSTF